MPEITDRGASNAINVDGTYHIMVAAIRHRQGQDPKDRIRGRIVNITLVDTFKAHPRDAHYAATKAAVVSLTKGRAHAVAPVAILVNPLALAGMATEKARQVLPSLRAASQLARAIRLAVARQRGKPPAW